MPLPAISCATWIVPCPVIPFSSDAWDEQPIGGLEAIDGFHLCIALTPLAVYIIILGGINLSKRPLVTTGARDMSALGVAISGLIAAGPMELLLPEAATNRFGGYVWLLLLAFYALCWTLIVLALRPRLVIYNVNPDRLRSVLAEVVSELDREASWAGDSLVLPQLGVQLHVEPFGLLGNTQLVASGPRQDFAGWRRLEEGLAKGLRQTKATRNRFGVSLFILGLFLLAVVIYQMISDPTMVVQSVNNMLHR